MNEPFPSSSQTSAEQIQTEGNCRLTDEVNSTGKETHGAVVARKINKRWTGKFTWASKTDSSSSIKRNWCFLFNNSLICWTTFFSDLNRTARRKFDLEPIDCFLFSHCWGSSDVFGPCFETDGLITAKRIDFSFLISFKRSMVSLQRDDNCIWITGAA